MASATGNSLMRRARTIASQTAGDANQSAIIDSFGGIRALLNHTIREVYRNHSKDPKFLRDIVTRQTVTVASGTGACPDAVMREFLSESTQFEDDNASLISYFTYQIDALSRLQPLGYVWMEGDNFIYAAPNGVDYSGNLFVTVPSFPTFPASMTSTIAFPSVAVIDDIVLALSAAITGKLAYEVV